MSLDSGSVTIEGFRGKMTQYLVELVDAHYSDGYVDLTIEYERDGDSAIVEELVALVRGGPDDERKEYVIDDARNIRSDVTITFEGEPDEELDVNFWADDWDDDVQEEEWLSFRVPGPDEPYEDDVSVSIDHEVIERDEMEFEYTVEVSEDSYDSIRVDLTLYDEFSGTEFTLSPVVIDPGDSFTGSEVLSFDHDDTDDVESEVCIEVDSIQFV